MASLVGSLRAMLTLDSAAFVAGSKSASRASKNLKNSMTPLRKAALGVSAALGVAAAGLALAIKGSLNAADDMSKAAQKFGVPIESLSRLKYAADLSDVSLQTLGTGLQQLSKKMAAAAAGGKAPVALFKEMGVEVVDASGKLRDTEAVLQDVSDVFANLPDGAGKTALAMKLFGKSGAELIPLLNSGKTGLQQMAEEANKLGLVIDAKTGKSAEAFNDNLTRLKAAMGGVVVQIASALAPTLEKLSEFAVKVANSFGELSPQTKELIVQIGSIFGVVALASAAFGTLAFVTSPLSVTLGLIAGAATLIYTNWAGIAQFFTDTWATIRTSTVLTWESVKRSIGGAIDWVQEKWDTFVASLQSAIEKAKAVGNAIAGALSAGKAEMNDGTGYGGMAGALDETQAFSGSSNSSSTAAGASTADGLVNGFKARLAERLGEIAAAAGTVTTTVRNQLGIQSPSTVFREIGQHTTEGLALGITDNVPLIKSAIGEVGDALEGDGNSLQSRLENFKSTLENAFVGLVTGALTFKDALAGLAKSLAEMLAKSAFQGLFKSLTSSGGFLSSLFGGAFAHGAAFNGGRIQAFATGGIVSSATAFGMQGGMGVMGEAGPEAIMPLTRGPGGKLGVQAHGGGANRIELVIREGDMFASKVESIADGRAVQVVRRYDRDVAPATRGRSARERG